MSAFGFAGFDSMDCRIALGRQAEAQQRRARDDQIGALGVGDGRLRGRECRASGPIPSAMARAIAAVFPQSDS